MDKTKIPIGDIMTRRPVTIKLGEVVSKAAQLMSKYEISSILIMQSKDIVGILTSDDIVYKVVAPGKNPDVLLVDDVMSKNISSVSPNSNMQEVMQLMSDNDIRQVPIVEGKQLLGLVTLKDILRHEPTLVDMMVENIRFEEEKRRASIQKYVNDDISEDLLE